MGVKELPKTMYDLRTNRVTFAKLSPDTVTEHAGQCLDLKLGFIKPAGETRKQPAHASEELVKLRAVQSLVETLVQVRAVLRPQHDASQHGSGSLDLREQGAFLPRISQEAEGPH